MPIHPLVVHFPIAVGSLMPLMIILSMISISKWQWPGRTWWVVIFFQAIFALSSIAATMSGEHDEETGLSPLVTGIHNHEEWGEKVAILAVVALIISTLPFLHSKKENIWKYCTLIISILGFVLLIKAGHTGGSLIYQLN